MPESFKTQRYEDRESSKVGLADYFSKHVVWLFLPFIGFAAGLGLRKLTKMPFLEKVSNPLGFLIMDKAERTAFQQAAEQSGQYIMRRGEAMGLGLGGVYGTYRLWSANTKQQLEVDQITKDVEALRAMESGNAYLKQENEQLRRQIKFSERHAPTASHAEHAQASKEQALEAQR